MIAPKSLIQEFVDPFTIVGFIDTGDTNIEFRTERESKSRGCTFKDCPGQVKAGNMICAFVCFPNK